MDKIIIHGEKCVGCSLCVDDCPNSCLRLEEGKAKFMKPACIECGHCYAICPRGAIRTSDYHCEDEPVVPMTVPDGDTLLSALRSRRTGQFSGLSLRVGYVQHIEQADKGILTVQAGVRQPALFIFPFR